MPAPVVEKHLMRNLSPSYLEIVCILPMRPAVHPFGTFGTIHTIYQNAKGQVRQWSNSLFEDNAEFGYGMYLAQSATRKRLASKVQSVLSTQSDVAVQEAGKLFRNIP